MDKISVSGTAITTGLWFQAVALPIAVLESEGLYTPLLADADILVRSSENALALLLNPKRLISGLKT